MRRTALALVATLALLAMLSRFSIAAEPPQSGPTVDAGGGIRIMFSTSKVSQIQARRGGFVGPIQRPPGASGGQAFLGAVIGLLIVGNITNKGESEEAEFRLQLARRMAAIDCERLMVEGYRSSLGGSHFLREATWETVSDVSDLEQAGLLLRISEARILTLDTEVQLPSKEGNLTLETHVKLWQKGVGVPAYIRNFSTPMEPEVGKGRNGWIEGQGEKLADALRQSVEQTTKGLLVDQSFIAALNAPLGQIAPSGASGTVTAPAAESRMPTSESDQSRVTDPAALSAMVAQPREIKPASH